MIVLKDRVKQIASVPVIPTGTLSLGPVPNGYQAFGSVLASGDQTYYVIETSNSFEIGIGRYGIEGSGTLTRDTVLTSSTGSKLSLTSRATVFITVPAAKFPFTDPSGELNLALNTLSDVGLAAPASGQSLVYNGSSWANSTITGYTTEEAQDAVGGILADTSSISFSYNDGTPSISASVRSSGITDVMISGGVDALKIGSGTVSSTEFGYLDGVTSSIQTQFGNKANTSTQVIAGTGLSGGGDLSTNRTINLANTTVAPGSYTLSSFTVDAQGRITAAASGSVDLSSYVSLSGSYSNPSWITGLAWSKISSTPTSLSGYGISGVKTDFDSACTDGNFMYVGDAPTSHTHGNITNAGAIGSASGLPIITTTGGVLTTGSFGTTAGTFAQGNDSRITGALSAATAASTYLPLAGGTLTGNLLFTDATYDIGASGATRPRDGFFSRDITFGQKMYIGTFPNYITTTGGSVTVHSNNGVGNSASFTFDVTGSFSMTGSVVCNGVTMGGSVAILSRAGSGEITWSNNGPADLTITPTSNILNQRNSTSAQTLRIHETYTSATSFGAFQIKANAGAAYQIGSAVGSAGGTNRAITFGHWNTGGSFTSSLSIDTTANQVQIGTIKAGYNTSFSTGVYGINLNNDTPNCTIWSGDSSAFGSSFSGYNVFMVGHDVGVLSGYGIGSYPKFVYSNGSSLSIPQICIGNASGFSGLDLSFGTTGTPSDGEYTVTSGYGANKFGASMWLMGGRSTGNGAGGSVYIGSSTTGSSGSTRNSNFTIAQFSPFFISFNQSIASSGSPAAFTVTGAAHTTLTASTEATDVNFNLARTVQFAAGALTTQRAFRIQAPTYSFASASTITTASTLSISGAPVAGTNATITNAYALNVESGNSFFYGRTQVGTTDSWNRPLSIGGNAQMHSSGYGELFVSCGTALGRYDVRLDQNGVSLRQNSTISGYHWYGTSPTAGASPTLSLVYDANDTLAQRRGTNAQTLRVYNTYTSATSGEWAEFNWATTSNVLRIGSNKGSVGGSARDVAITHGGTVVANFLSDRFYLGPIADSTATGGNTRGQYAVDLQINRSAATQVASGAYSICMGVTNTSSNTSSIAIGNDCTASGLNSQAIGNAASATASYSLAIGRNVFALGIATTAIGSYNTASGNYSSAFGSQAYSDRYGQFSHCANIFAAQGDAQFVRFILRHKTTNTTPTTLMLDGSSARLTIPSGKTMSCKVMVKGIKSDGSAKARFVRLVEITNVGGTTSLDMSPEALGTDYNPSGCACDITADNTNDALDISVTGITSETWRWVAVVEGLEIAYGT